MRALSGLQATGSIHLGNYIGAVRIWAESQDKYDENIYFVPDLHSLNVRRDPKQFRQDILEAVAVLLAAGIDPKKSIVFAQSTVPAHSELFNILNNYVTIGELSRMTQYKEKKQKMGGEGAVVGLFEYPVLMAADILLYDVDVVPVGADQKQHVELARDIASRFNKLHGDTFKLPKAVIPEAGSRVMNLQDPTKKMSKSDRDSAGCIFLSDSEADIKRKISSAVTDSDGKVRADHKNKPGITNLLDIYATLSGKSSKEIEHQYKDKGYGEFKTDLADLVVNVLAPIKQKHDALLTNPTQILKVLKDGQAKAQKLADAKLVDVKNKIGLITL